jgi:hypothetical protein
MKFYCCAFFLVALGPQARGSDPARVIYHLDTVAGSGRIGDGGPAVAAQFSNISGIAVSPLGTMYLSDTDNHRAQSRLPASSPQSRDGHRRLQRRGGPAINAQLRRPYGLHSMERVTCILPTSVTRAYAVSMPMASSPPSPATH